MSDFPYNLVPETINRTRPISFEWSKNLSLELNNGNKIKKAIMGVKGFKISGLLSNQKI